jgi:hypothetical protein
VEERRIVGESCLGRLLTDEASVTV